MIVIAIRLTVCPKSLGHRGALTCKSDTADVLRAVWPNHQSAPDVVAQHTCRTTRLCTGIESCRQLVRGQVSCPAAVNAAAGTGFADQPWALRSQRRSGLTDFGAVQNSMSHTW